MPFFDIALIVIIATFALSGYRYGAVQALGNVVGTILGVYLATRYYEPMAAFLGNVTGWEGNVPNVVMFILAFIVINRLVGFGFWLIARVTNLVTKLPFISTVDKMAGLIFGILEGIITIGVIIYFLERYPVSEKLMIMIAESDLAEQIRKIANLFIPLFPEGLKLLHSSVDFVEGLFLK